MASHASDKDLTTFRETNPPDVTLIAGMEELKIEAHKQVLCASSEFFQAMFQTELKETQTSEVRLDCIDGVTVKLILDYIYTTRIELSGENVEGVLKAAHYFQMNKLSTECCNFMGTQLDSANCLAAFFIAEQYGNLKLLEKSFEFVCNQLKEVVTGQQFLELDAQQLDALFTTIGPRYRLQEVFFHSLVAWCQYSKEKRQTFLPSLLLKHIRFGWLDSKFIAEKGRQVSEILQSSKLVNTMLKCHTSPESHETEKKKLAIIFNPGGKTHFDVKLYNEDLQTWSFEEWPNPHMRTEFGMVVMKNKLIIAGGRNRGETTNKVECLDLQTMKWSDLPPTSSCSHSLALAEFKGILHLFDCSKGAIEKYNSSTKEWQHTMSKNNRQICQSTVATCNGKIYAAKPNCSAIYCYNSMSNNWDYTPPSDPRNAGLFSWYQIRGIAEKPGDVCSMAGLNELLYVGGVQSSAAGDVTSTLQSYNPLNGRWKRIKSSNVWLKCWTHNDQLYVCSNRYQDIFVEQYVPENDEWKSLPPLLFTLPSVCSTHEKDFHIFSV